MSSSSTRNKANSDTQDEEELLRNVATTIVQPPNKFFSNIKKVSGKPLPARKTDTVGICYERGEDSRQNTKKSLTRDLDTKKVAHLKREKDNLESNNMESSRSLQLLEEFSKKKQERDQEIMEIQEMLNKIKSPTKSVEQVSPKTARVEDSPKEEKELVKDNEEPEEKEEKPKKEDNKVPFYGRSKTELQLNLKPTESTNFRLTRRDTSRSCSIAAMSSKPRSKSSQLPLTAKETQNIKKISYDPEEARRYMKMQRKQRKVDLFQDPKIKSKIEKEEIKKRLEELKKNSRKLVYKNLQKKEKCMGTILTNKELEVKLLTTPTPQEQKNINDPKIGTSELSRDIQEARVSSRICRTDSNSKETGQEISHRSSRSLINALKPAIPLLENHKRIGLLRKTESDKDFSIQSHRNYNFNKENQNIERLRKQLLNAKEIKINRGENNMTDKELEVQEQANFKKDKEIQASLKEEGIGESKLSNLETKNIKTSKSEEKQETSINTESAQMEVPKTHGLPYWLRPSSAQVYPYNFIVAVRRKLEAIAQPLITSNHKEDNKRNQETSTTSLNNQLKQKKRKPMEAAEEKKSKKLKRKPDYADTEEKVVERDVTESTFKQQKPLPQHMQMNEYEGRKKEQFHAEQPKTDMIPHEDEAKCMSQFQTLHKSEQSLGKCDAKEIDKTKSYKQIQDIPPYKPIQTSDPEDYKRNSQQFKLPTNYKSMESLNSEINSNLSSISLQMPISNTLTEVSSLRTESRMTYTQSMKQLPTQSEDDVNSLSSQVLSSPEKKLAKMQEDFEFVKPRPVSPLSLEKIEKLKIKRKESNETGNDDGEMSFTQLLEDFNRSLSQVIQVNEQLKCTLDKSQQILSPCSTKKSSEADKQYSSDFEVSTLSKENDRLKESLQKSNDTLKQRKSQLFEMAEKVMPLLTSQTLEEDVGYKAFCSVKEKSLLRDPKMKFLTNSPGTTEEKERKIPRDIVEDEDEEQTSSSNAAQSSGERLYEIEKLKETLKQTILESKEKRKEKELREEKKSESLKPKDTTLSSENKSQPRTKNGNTCSRLPVENQTQCEEYKNEREGVSSKNLHENYQKQYKYSFKTESNENVKTAISENDLQSQTINSNGMQNNVNVNKYSNSNEMLQFDKSTHKKFLVQKSQEVTDYSTFDSNSNSNNVSSRWHTKSVSNNTLSNNNTMQSNRHSKQTLSDNETRSQSEADSTAQTREATKSRSVSKTSKTDATISSSIAEELQKTFESRSYENDDVPLKSKAKTKGTNIFNEHNDSTKFIESHINRSRGDFQENITKASEFHESQFQQAIEAAATTHVSSSEFAQSADDEITSSVASNSCHKPAINPSSHNDASSGKLICERLLPTTSPSRANRRISIGSEIVKFFSQYDVERTERHATINDSMSESSLNYSNVGLYDKLIQNENNKSQHLTNLLKMREKALLDRTKGQIAWLEVQKARYKAKGLINYIAAIKKKQRGILLKMEKEREEIKRLLYNTTTNSKAAAAPTLQTEGHRTNSHHNTFAKHKKEKLPCSSASSLIKSKVLGQQQTGKTENALSASPILRATYELESGRAVVELLKKRENDLRKRREHVERLMKWHQRLDEEEAEVLNLERQLLHYNNVPQMVEQQQSKLPTATTSATTKKLTSAPTAISTTTHEQANTSSIRTPEKKRAIRARKMEKRLKEIDKSLRELSHISASSATSAVMGQNHNEREDSSVSSVDAQEVDFVRTTGLKLNKLWKRLTSQQIEKFEPTRRYKLCKSDLERLYEEAKMAVLRDFAEDEERIAKELLEKSASNLSSNTSPTGQIDLPTTAVDDKIIEVPMLNLNFSSGHSEAEEESANNSHANVTQQGNYSPSVAEQTFKAQVLLNSSASSETISEQQTPEEGRQTSRLENNVQMFLALSQRIQASGRQLQSTNGRHICGGPAAEGLQRSLSDTEIFDVPKFKADKTATSQKNIATLTSHSNSTITNISSARSFDASEQHQRSKSSIVEMTYIPSTQTQTETETQTNHTDFSHTFTQHSNDHDPGNKQDETLKDLRKINHHSTSRSSVICSVGAVTPIKTSQQTSSDIATITENSKSSPSPSPSPTLKTKSITNVSTVCQSLKQKLSYSGQISTDSETKAKEISSKLDEITAAVAQLSQMNALPSYESVTHSHSKHKSIDEAIVNTNSDSSLTTDASSYSFNFDNITTDKHSSPGTPTPCTTSLQHKTIITSQTYTKEDDREHSATTYSDASASPKSTGSKTFTKGDAKTSSQQTLTQSMLENRILDTYEADFESDLSNVTHIEDITIPAFETTAETSQDDDAELSSKSLSKLENAITSHSENVRTKISDKTYNAEELKNALSPSGSEKSLSPSDFKSHIYSPDRELLTPPPPLPIPPPPLPPSTVTTAASISTIATATTSSHTGNNHLMPDIINELELRRHQLILDNEHIKQYEHVTAVPYMYVREIPNKPPPPYVPPAHGSPMTTIFPSEERIKDITFRRTHELYCELLKTEYCNEKGEKLPSVMEEQITNIYERIILDICREYLEDHGEILQDGDPTNFHSQLAFFNPPNRLRCIQDAIYKEVRTCLAMDKTQPKRTQIYSVYGQRAKQDHIGKIIIQEMYDEDDRWCNFHREESEVLHLMVEEMMNKNVVDIAKEVLLEEGGTIDEEEEQVVAEEIVRAEDFVGNINDEKRHEGSQSETSSVLVETINEEDQTHCINERELECSVLNETTRIESDPQESANVNSTNISTTANTVPTCS